MANEPHDRSTGRTILAVDDEADLLDAVRRILSRQGHTVLAATGPAEALALCLQYPGNIDLLLTDVRMPGGTGTDLATEAARRRPGLPVLFMSGLYDARHDELHGAAQILSKPFTPTGLTEAVESALSARARR